MILILSLGRTGSLPIYAENIVKNFKILNHEFYASKFRVNKHKHNFSIKETITYRGKLSFVINTIFVLPVLIIKLLPKIVRTYDVLYLPYKHFWDLPFIFLFKTFHKKVIFTAHDGILHKGERNWFTQLMNNYRLKHADEVIFLTNYARNNVVKELGINPAYEIIPHPIINNNYVKIKGNSQTKNLLFLGRIDKYKGVELLLESVLEIEDDFEKLIIAGKSQYDIKYKEHKKIEVQDKYLSEKEIGELLTWADVLVIPYTEATQSGVISLGIYAELPMVCTKVGGLKEQLLEDECFWCEPNKESIAEAISKSLSDIDKRKNIAEKLKKKKSLLSWKIISLKLENNIIQIKNYGS